MVTASRGREFRDAPNERLVARHDAANLEAATLIAADPERYPGEMQEWADLVLSRAAEAKDEDAGPLFRSVA